MIGYAHWGVECRDCKVETGNYSSKEAAGKVWNKRCGVNIADFKNLIEIWMQQHKEYELLGCSDEEVCMVRNAHNYCASDLLKLLNGDKSVIEKVEDNKAT